MIKNIYNTQNNLLLNNLMHFYKDEAFLNKMLKKVFKEMRQGKI